MLDARSRWLSGSCCQSIWHGRWQLASGAEPVRKLSVGVFSRKCNLLLAQVRSGHGHVHWPLRGKEDWHTLVIMFPRMLAIGLWLIEFAGPAGPALCSVIQVRVVDSDQTPVNKAEVRLQVFGMVEPPRTAQTNAAGEYRIKGVRRGV